MLFYVIIYWAIGLALSLTFGRNTWKYSIMCLESVFEETQRVKNENGKRKFVIISCVFGAIELGFVYPIILVIDLVKMAFKKH